MSITIATVVVFKEHLFSSAIPTRFQSCNERSGYLEWGCERDVGDMIIKEDFNDNSYTAATDESSLYCF